MNVNCAKCGAELDGYIREDDAVMVENTTGLGYQNSWVYGCKFCKPEKEA